MTSSATEFAYLTCVSVPDFARQRFGWAASIPAPVLSFFVKGRVAQAGCVVSTRGKKVCGYMINCPEMAFSKQAQDEYSVFNQVLSAGKLAKSIGVHTVGLDGFSRLLGARAASLPKIAKVAFTTGISLAAWSLYEALYRCAGKQGIVPGRTVVAFVNPEDAAISLCCRKAAGSVREVVLCGKDEVFLARLKDKLFEESGCQARIEADLSKAVQSADIVLVGEGRIDFKPVSGLRPGTVICHLASAGTGPLKAAEYPSAVVVEGGLIRLPKGSTLSAGKGFVPGVVPASLAETALLALEQRLGAYSLDWSTNPDKLEEIADMAARHGFEVWIPQAPLT